LEVAFRRNTCFVRNLEGVDLLKGNRTTNLYTINLHEMASTSPICLIARATSTKSCVGISHQASSVRTPQQNRVVERRNQTLVEAARTMLIFSCASLFLRAEAIDTALLIGYSATSCVYGFYNQRTKKIMETINVTFDELSRLQGMTSGQISLGLDLTYAPLTITSQKPTERELDLILVVNRQLLQ
ncbi:integrase, catalytic region, zinc finger, CCHC-type containing protein, partial [Tanacetum coccineum]